MALERECTPSRRRIPPARWPNRPIPPASAPTTSSAANALPARKGSASIFPTSRRNLCKSEAILVSGQAWKWIDGLWVDGIDVSFMHASNVGDMTMWRRQWSGALVDLIFRRETLGFSRIRTQLGTSWIKYRIKCSSHRSENYQERWNKCKVIQSKQHLRAIR